MRRQPTAPFIQPQREVRGALNEHLLDWLMRPHAEHLPVTLEDMLRRPEWHRQAACRGAGASGFVKSTGGAYGATRRACARCPVRQECLDFALADESIVGLWGGTSDAERRELRRRAVA
jgi:WhiB family transcriptional regulator, redox-sensing transcriptional regulator